MLNYGKTGKRKSNRTPGIIKLTFHDAPSVLFFNNVIELNEVQKFPLVKEANYSEIVLGPGEMLFIPRYYWHFVVAIDRDTALHWRWKYCQNNRKPVSLPFADGNTSNYSFSVSFWWGERILKV